MGTITMMASGKDGIGKSTVSVFTGAALARRGQKTLVIELDSGLRSVDVISGVYSHIVYDVLDVLEGRCEPKKAIVRSPICDNLYIMSAPFTSGSISAERFLKLCTVLNDDFDHIIIDAASVLGATLIAASAAMRAIIVTTADPIGVRGSRDLADRLSELSINDIRLVINRLVPSRIAHGIVPNLDYCIDAIGARLLGVVPEDDDIALACAGVRHLPDRSVARKVFQNIAERICGIDTPLLIR